MNDDVFAPTYAHLVRTRAYLGALPYGLASYPECRSKGQVWKNILRWTDTGPLVGMVPEEVPIVPESGLLASSWVPAVQSFAAHLVLRDCLFTSDEAMCSHFRLVDRRLLGGPIYRTLFALATPMLAVRAADRQFSAMFEGLTLRAASECPGHVHLLLNYPPKILPALVGRLYLVAFEVAVELAGGTTVEGKVLSHGATAAQYEITWI
jgi:hypothetical protein